MTDAEILALFGLAYLAIGVGTLADASVPKKLIRDFSDNRGLSYLAGLFALILGYAIVVTRTGWTNDWHSVVLALGWIALFKGFFLIAAPEWSLSVAKNLVKRRGFSAWFTFGLIAVGAAATGFALFLAK